MRTYSPTAVRGALVGVFAVLAVALVVPTVSAQFQPGRPGVPGGMPGMPNIPRPQFPPIQPPRFPDLPGPGFGGGLGGIPETIYYCKKCRTELGRGPFPPLSATCRCGLTYNNGVALDNGPNNRPFGGPELPLQPPLNTPFNPPFNPNPNPNRVPPAQPVNLPNGGVPNLQPVFAEDNNGAEVGRNNAPLPPVDLGTPGSPSSPAPVAAVPPPKPSNRGLFMIGGVVLGLLVVLGMVVGFLYVKANAKQSRPAGRRRGDWDDE